MCQRSVGRGPRRVRCPEWGGAGPVVIDGGEVAFVEVDPFAGCLGATSTGGACSLPIVAVGQVPEGASIVIEATVVAGDDAVPDSMSLRAL